jgi:hypothetical protein
MVRQPVKSGWVVFGTLPIIGDESNGIAGPA